MTWQQQSQSNLTRVLSRRRSPLAIGLIAAALSALWATPGRAQAPAFFAGKTVELYIGNDAGSSYDTYARLLVRHIVNFIPGQPTIVPRNMPGAGSMRAMNFLYEVARKDGTAWAGIDRTIATEPLLAGAESKAAFKTALDFNWIGSLNTEIGVAAVWHTTGITNWEQTKVRPVIVAMAGATGGVGARALNSFLGTQFRQVCCYGGDGNQNLALESGEVEGRIGWSWSSLKATHMDWLQSGKIKILMQVGLQKNPEIPGDPPLVVDLARTQRDKNALMLIFANQSMGRPFVMPPKVAPDIVLQVRQAFTAMIKDREFLADARARSLEIVDPKSGEELQRLLGEVYGAPSDAIAAAQAAMKTVETTTKADKK